MSNAQPDQAATLMEPRFGQMRRGASNSHWRGLVPSASQEPCSIWPTRLAEITALMDQLAEDSGQDDWDGEGALALKQDSLERCKWALFNLREELPLPSLWCEPIGRINACWENGIANLNIAFCADREFLVVGMDSSGRDIVKRTHEWKVAESYLRTIYEV